MKKNRFKLLSALCCMVLSAALLAGCAGENAKDVEKPAKQANKGDLDSAVSAFLLEDNKDSYSAGECAGEGHLILGTEEKDGHTVAYLLTMYGQFDFENGMLVKCSGSGVIPAVMTLSKKDGKYTGESIEYPEDGAGYETSIKKMFPEKYQSRVLTEHNSDYKQLKSQETAYARAYLKEIGREDAKIGEYADLDTKILTDCGVSVDDSNYLLDISALQNYPMFVGTREKLEGGKRYVYECKVDESAIKVIYSKYEYENPKNVAEQLVFDMKTHKLGEVYGGRQQTSPK